MNKGDLSERMRAKETVARCLQLYQHNRVYIHLNYITRRTLKTVCMENKARTSVLVQYEDTSREMIAELEIANHVDPRVF